MVDVSGALEFAARTHLDDGEYGGEGDAEDEDEEEEAVEAHVALGVEDGEEEEAESAEEGEEDGEDGHCFLARARVGEESESSSLSLVTTI